MYPGIGHWSVIIAMLLSLLLAVNYPANKIKSFSFVLPQAIFFLLALAFSCLVYSFVVSDFSVLNVAVNSHTSKPLIYKISASWGNHEGSMLMFVLLMSVYTALFSARESISATKNLVLRLQGGILFIFLSYIVLTSNPFIVIDGETPANGQGFNPLLQDIGLAFHPPMLYLGYCGFSLAISLAIASLIEKKLSRNWAKSLRAWLLVPWGFLTIGIGLGSWWAYRELGWGGFWFWDPVENSSLMPWLSATALIHSVIVTEKKGTFKGWTNLLAILTFSFCLTGFFLVRSGVLTSVHSFATDPTRGSFILVMMAIIIGGSLVLYALRAHLLYRSAVINYFSRDSFILVNNIFLVTLCGTILIGTVYPIILEVFSGQRISVGEPYYRETFTPVAIFVLLFAAVAPYLRWNIDKLENIVAALKKPAGISLFIGILILFIYKLPVDFYAVLAIIISVFLITSISNYVYTAKTRSSIYKNLGLILGHFGIGLVALSIAVSSAGSKEQTLLMKKGVPVEFAGYSIEYQDDDVVIDKNFIARRGTVNISSDKVNIGTLYPEIRYYPVEQSRTTEAAIMSRFMTDLYVVLGEAESPTTSTIRMYYKPMIKGIWAGVMLTGLAGIISLFRRTKR